MFGTSTPCKFLPKQPTDFYGAKRSFGSGLKHARSIKSMCSSDKALPRAITAKGVEEIELSQETRGIQAAVDLFEGVEDSKEQYLLLLAAANRLPPYAEENKTVEFRVLGCTAKVWISATLDDSYRVHFSGTSDSQLTKGLFAVLSDILSGLTPEDILQSRTNGLLNMVETMKKRTRMLIKKFPSFPSLVISADELNPIGDFAKAQAQFLEPGQEAAERLAMALREKKIGVVAHFYMDPEVQGVLSAASEFWPHIHVSDSLVMADLSVQMAEAGCNYIAVLGVDFMSENVRAILTQAGYEHVKVYRMSEDKIGCSLAEAAETDAYIQYLSMTQQNNAPNLHVIYINTSLKTKALSNSVVPTITCTSSNVTQTILQAFAQVPDLNVWYGPDTYMGQNLVHLFTALADMSDEDIRALHPQHDQKSIRSLLGRLHYFQDGTCIVHHLFGGEVCQLVKDAYGDAYIAAHFEVPGDMFLQALEARKRGMGVVGSTSQILAFIGSVVEDELQSPRSERLRFILGTEAGMITSIVQKVQTMLQTRPDVSLEVEIVFPVSPQSISTETQETSAGITPLDLPDGISVIPGSPQGEGCSLSGGCATCPYMKMNSLSALTHVVNCIGSPVGEALLANYLPKEEGPDAQSIARAGCTPILHMRGFQKSGRLPPDLEQEIMVRMSGSDS